MKGRASNNIEYLIVKQKIYVVVVCRVVALVCCEASATLAYTYSILDVPVRSVVRTGTSSTYQLLPSASSAMFNVVLLFLSAKARFENIIFSTCGRFNDRYNGGVQYITHHLQSRRFHIMVHGLFIVWRPCNRTRGSKIVSVSRVYDCSAGMVRYCTYCTYPYAQAHYSAYNQPTATTTQQNPMALQSTL